MAKKSATGPQAVFDYDRVDSTWAERFQESLTAAAEAQSIIQRPIPPSMSDPDDEKYDEDKSQVFFDRRDAALETIRNSPKEQKKLLTEVLVDVPREWLVSDAPDEIDWSNVDNLKFVSYDGYTKLLTQWIQGGGARAKAKN